MAANFRLVDTDNPALQAQLDRVLDNFENDSERLVYADMLTKAGDLRGEFIHLQSLKQPTTKQQRRIKEMLRKESGSLAGILDKLLLDKKRTFAHGFLVKCTTAPRDGTLSALVAQPLARTIKNLTVTTASSLAPMSDLTRLEFLDLSHTQVGSLTPLMNLTNLESLSLSGCENVADLTPLGTLAALRVLNLSDTSPNNLLALAKLPHLEHLDLSETNTKDLRSVANLINLKSLVLNHVCRDLDVAPLVALTKLQSLDLSGTRPHNFLALAKLPKLRTLVLEETAVSTSEIRKLRKALPGTKIRHWFY